MIWHVSEEEVWIVPIEGVKTSPRHRSEIPIEDLVNLIACGISKHHLPVVQCHKPFKANLRRMSEAAIFGIAPAPLLNRIIQAIHKEARTRQAEDTGYFTGTPSARGMALAA